ncbi:helix-turn-helix domain-containing protein [Thermomonospora amylolytica]|uniref:helix-turn-helix domain-containing protein n=1 Tax=Thermomonospora amylolytica TaxID=1411117 RepID=UPI000E6CC488|nr:helix-turn-helix transcriptional regulator [Thermomonospora amylolytica]
MANEQSRIAHVLRRLRLARGWSWTEQARHLRRTARELGFARIGAATTSSVQRTIARWESGRTVPSEQYQVLLAHLYGRTNRGEAALGPGSDFAELLAAFAGMGVDPERLEELTADVAAHVTDRGSGPQMFLSDPLRARLATALADPDTIDVEVVADLGAATDAVDRRIGTMPFARLYLAQTAIVDACRRLLAGEQPPPVRDRLSQVAATAYALAARLAFESHDDATAFALYDEAVALAQGAVRARIRTGQAMVTHYATGDVAKARRIADAAAQDVHRDGGPLLRARVHAIRAELAARAGHPRSAHVALHLAEHALDAATGDDPDPDVFSEERLHGFHGVCGIFLGTAAAAEQHLARSAARLTRPRDAVQRAIVLTDQAVARLRTGDPGAPEAAAGLLHACVDLVAATRGRVAALRIRRARLELRPWYNERFVTDLDDHMHTALIGI